MFFRFHHYLQYRTICYFRVLILPCLVPLEQCTMFFKKSQDKLTNHVRSVVLWHGFTDIARENKKFFLVSQLSKNFWPHMILGKGLYPLQS